MIAQRGYGVKARTRSDKVAQTNRSNGNGPRNASPKPKGKLSYKHKHRLEKLPVEMEKCAAHIAVLETQLSDPDLFGSNPVEFNTLAEKLETQKTALGRLEDEWLELEALKEDLS